mmetsp:Transcript_55939/g.126202  ORF Transcript_55939/g.126202 Transcript_55939/m.126202 type:complete len:231 (+) Transcript_55939:163-855(+)
MKSKYQAWSKEPLKKLQLRLASSRQGPASLVRARSQPASGTSGQSFSWASMQVCTLALKSGMVMPWYSLPLSGWRTKLGGGVQRQPRALHRPTWYQCMFESPCPITPVFMSTLNMTAEWSVSALVRPARRTHDRARTPDSPAMPPRDAVMTRKVDSGASFGSNEQRKSSLFSAAWMIQSPPCTAFLKKWMPRPPSSFLCLHTNLGSLRKGVTATPRSSPHWRKVHLFSAS